MKCPTCKGHKCADCNKVICMHTGRNWGGKSYATTDTRLCLGCCTSRAAKRVKRIILKRKLMKNSYDDFSHLVELVPGVFVDNKSRDYTAVHIVDAEGEVVTWNSDEVFEDPSAFIAAITAVALAAKYRTEFVRVNLLNKGQCVRDMIAETKRHVDNMLPLPDHKHGYTQPLVNAILDKRGLESKPFWEWMHHQTMGVTDTGGKVVYLADLANYLVNGGSEAPIND